jgi:DNA-binding transcriptional LysR family regulator
LAIRMGEPKDSRMVAVKLEDATLGIYASPAYLRRQGAPRKLEDLAQHDCIQFILPSSGRPMPWLLRQRSVDTEYGFNSPIKFEGDVLGGVNYAKAGGGLFQIYHFIGNSEEYQGKLVEVLKPYSGSARPFSILYPQNRHLSAKVRAFVDFMLGKVKT